MIRTPAEREIDGISLAMFTAGSVREVSPTTAAWLIAEGYAEPEMRSEPGDNTAVDRHGGKTHARPERRQPKR